MEVSRLAARYEIAHGRDVRQPLRVRCRGHGEGAQFACRVGDPVVLGIVIGTGTLDAELTCDTNPVLTDETGNAVFNGCRIDKAGSGYLLVAQVSRIAGQTATSRAIRIVSD